MPAVEEFLIEKYVDDSFIYTKIFIWDYFSFIKISLDTEILTTCYLGGSIAYN